MLKKIILTILIIVLTFLLKNKTVDITNVFKELEDRTINTDDQIKKYYISYKNKNITTNNLYDELKVIENDNKTKITIISSIKNETIEYNITATNLKKQIGNFFSYYMKLLEEKNLDKEIERAYLKGININDLIIIAPEIIGNKYLNNTKDIIYQIK